MRTINSNNLDPLDHFSLEDVLVIAQREQKFKGLVVPPKGDDGDETYKAKLVQVCFVQEDYFETHVNQNICVMCVQRVNKIL